MKRKFITRAKKIAAGILTAILTVGSIPAVGVKTMAAENDDYVLSNGFIKAEVSEKNGGFYFSTVLGDKVNKSDDNKALLFHNGIDDTSFTSFRVTRGNETKEYIFGGEYEGSSEIVLSKTEREIMATWSVDDITFTQTISLVNSGALEHGMAYISYTAQNNGEKADIKARLLMDTALGYQDFAYYSIGSGTSLIEKEMTLGEDGYNKSFYGYDDPYNPQISSYFVNASVDNKECKPYQTTFAHWNNLASTVFDYTCDSGLTFTNPYNKKYLTADSAVAFYYDLGDVQKNDSGTFAINYGVYSNEKSELKDKVAVNIASPDVLELTDDKSAYKDDGIFTIKTHIQNISDTDIKKMRIVVYSTMDIKPLDSRGEVVDATYDNPYSLEYIEFVSGDMKTTEWQFKAIPDSEGQYAVIHYKVYDVSVNDTLVEDYLIGEASTYILCPGSVTNIPKIQFTSTSPDIIYYQGERSINVTGKNFSMLSDRSKYRVLLRRTDGLPINGNNYYEIPQSNVKINVEKNVITFILTDDIPGTIPEGQYEFIFDYMDVDKTDLTAPALRFQVSSNVKYRNDTYGLLVVEKDEARMKYHIKTYKDEEEYKRAKSLDDTLIKRSLLEFRGIFTIEHQPGKTVYSGISLGDDDNVITLNSCLDIKNGTTTISENADGVYVDFDATITTTGSGTSVWKGVCALTALKNGTDYGLIPYKENGERKKFEYNTITLLWPSVGQAAKSLLGLLMDFKYGELGMIEHENGSETRVVAFGAALDLGFVANKSYEGNDPYVLEKAYDRALSKGVIGADGLRFINDSVPYNSDTADTDGDGDTLEFSGRIQIDDVLFGGKYLGVCFSVNLGIPALVEGMPEIEGTLTIRTVGDWETGVSGICDFDMFCLEAEIEIKSNDNIVVPDKFRVFLGNMTPGINVDGVGILWLQGAGGGIDDLYDTIFLRDSVPPLKLLLEAQFSLMQVISARAALELSLRGIKVELTNGKIANNIEVLKKAKLQIDWYPEFYFLSSVHINILDVIYGGGYIVAESNGFFEFFINAALKVPDEVPLLGGVTVASAGLGANKEKIWGQVSVIGVELGVVYYWTGNFDWGGGTAAKPTYPELAGMSSSSYSAFSSDVPVYYDKETDRTLMMHVGTNFNPHTAVLLDSFDKITLDTAPSAISNELYTKPDGREHLLLLGAKQKDEILAIEWDAESREEAETDVSNIVITDGRYGYGLNLFDHSKDAESQPESNANLSYNETTKKAILAISFTDSMVFEKEWTIKTKKVSNVTLFDLEPAPEISDETEISISNQNMIVDLKGKELDKFDKVLYTAVPKDESKEAMLIYKQEAPIIEGNSIITLPYDLESGDYILKIMASDDNSTYYSYVEKEFSYINQNQPKAPEGISVKNGGDYRMQIEIDKPADTPDGYSITVYDKDGNIVSGLNDLMYTADGESVQYDNDGNIINGEEAKEKVVVFAGGQYTYKDSETGELKVVGLEPNESYSVGVRSWKLMDNGGLIYSSEKNSRTITINERINTDIEISCNSASVQIEEKRTNSAGEEIVFTIPYYRTDNLIIDVNASDKISAEWKLDGGLRTQDCGKINETDTAKIVLNSLTQGVHTLEIKGVNENGDSIRNTYTFGVDSEGPKLLISNPVSGSVYDFDSGEIVIQGLTEDGIKLTVTEKNTGKVYCKNRVVNTDKDGVFEETISIDTDSISQTIIITGTDSAGNTTDKEISLVNSAMGMIESIEIYSGNMKVGNKKIASGANYPLSVKANLTDGSELDITDSEYIDWKHDSIKGNSELTGSGKDIVLVTGEDSIGMVTARFLVSDSGAYSVSTLYDLPAGTNEINENNTIVIINQTNYFTGKAVEVSPVVYCKGIKLTEGVDYSLSYENNINVTTDSEKAVVVINGQGNYKGSVTRTFDIVYLESDGCYKVTGSNGENGWYVSDVSIAPNAGYEISESQTKGYYEDSLIIQEEGKNTKTFFIRRISDGAITDAIDVHIEIDKSSPEGSVTLASKMWDSLRKYISFVQYYLKDEAYIVNATDKVSGLAKIEYVITDKKYESLEMLLSDNPVWQTYERNNPPKTEEGKKQCVYIRLKDTAGNIRYINTDGIIADTTAPVLSEVKILDDDSLGSLKADISFVVNEAGICYYALVPEGIDTPSADDVIAGNITGAVCGKIEVSDEMLAERSSGKAITCTVEGLKRNTVYYLFMVAEDNALSIDTGERKANVSEIAASESVRTLDVLTDINDKEISFEMSESVLYTGEEVMPEIEIKNGNIVLVEGIDYILKASDNTDVTGDKKAQLIIIGQGDYSGEKIVEFEIRYMDSEGTYEIVGMAGTDGWYRNVGLAAKEGYEIVPDVNIAEGEQDISFRVKNKQTKALSDIIVLHIKADYTVPTGMIKIAGKEWTQFTKNVEIESVRALKYELEIKAEDNLSGISSVKYAVSIGKNYADENELKSANLEWKTYSGDEQIYLADGMVIYVELVDNAGNISYLSTDEFKIINSGNAPEAGEKKYIIICLASVGLIASGAFIVYGVKHNKKRKKMV